MIDRYSSSITKELMYFFAYQYKNKDCQFYFSRFDATINEPYLKQVLISTKNTAPETFTTFNVIEKIKKHPAGEPLAARLSTLLQKHKDAYIFMDFWGSWCAPCMSEMPLYPKLIENFKDKSVFFLFLAVDTKEEKIQEVKNKHKIRGEFISLNDNETKILNNVLEFSSYPRHFLLDLKGMLLTDKISSISSGGELSKQTVEQLKNIISKTKD